MRPGESLALIRSIDKFVSYYPISVSHARTASAVELYLLKCCAKRTKTCSSVALVRRNLLRIIDRKRYDVLTDVVRNSRNITNELDVFYTSFVKARLVVAVAAR